MISIYVRLLDEKRIDKVLFDFDIARILIITCHYTHMTSIKLKGNNIYVRIFKTKYQDFSFYS